MKLLVSDTELIRAKESHLRVISYLEWFYTALYFLVRWRLKSVKNRSLFNDRRRSLEMFRISIFFDRKEKYQALIFSFFWIKPKGECSIGKHKRFVIGLDPDYYRDKFFCIFLPFSFLPVEKAAQKGTMRYWQA